MKSYMTLIFSICLAIKGMYEAIINGLESQWFPFFMVLSVIGLIVSAVFKSVELEKIEELFNKNKEENKND